MSDQIPNEMEKEVKEIVDARVAAAVDREKVCPFLLRIFWKLHVHHRTDEWRVPMNSRVRTYPSDEIMVYTWMDATLREIADLIKETRPEARDSRARLHFCSVFPNQSGRHIMREIGVCYADPSRRADDNKCLRDLRFQVGDCIDVAIQ